MKRKPIPLFVLLIIFGIPGLLRYSQDIPSINTVALVGSGFAFGMGVMGIILTLKYWSKND